MLLRYGASGGLLASLNGSRFAELLTILSDIAPVRRHSCQNRPPFRVNRQSIRRCGAWAHYPLARSVRRCSLGRVMSLMNFARRKRTADQSSSIATIRTGSKPSRPSASQPRSRLISDLYFFEVPLAYASHTIASPSAFRAICAYRKYRTK